MYYFQVKFCDLWCECPKPIFLVKDYQSRLSLVQKLTCIDIYIDINDIKCAPKPHFYNYKLMMTPNHTVFLDANTIQNKC